MARENGKGVLFLVVFVVAVGYCLLLVIVCCRLLLYNRRLPEMVVIGYEDVLGYHDTFGYKGDMDAME